MKETLKNLSKEKKSIFNIAKVTILCISNINESLYNIFKKIIFMPIYIRSLINDLYLLNLIKRELL